MCTIQPSPGGFPRGRPALLHFRFVKCSARGCKEQAVWALRWNNPKIHDPDRRKVWLACEGHREHLSDFLAARGFLREVDRSLEA